MAALLSPYRLKKAREVYNYFNIFNAISWNLLVGIIITLFALRLGASSTYIGLLGASVYVALFMLPLGKVLTRRFSIIGIFSVTWILRSISMIFAVAAPFMEYAGYRNTALVLVMLGVFSFHILRGIGMIGNNPVLSLLTSGPDRGSYMTQIQIISSSIGMFGSFLIAMVLGMNPPVFIFSVLLLAGVITGIISGCVIKNVPEPPEQTEGMKMKLFDIFRDALTCNDLRHFMFILFLVAMVSGVTRTFIVVYAREVFGHSDGLISLYSVFGGLGFLIAGLSVKFLVDRIGTKPLFIVCVIIGFISIIPVIFIPASAADNMTSAILFMVFMFFTLNFGFLGSEGIAHTYYLALIPEEKSLNLGILYFFIFGIAGAGGSFIAGILLDLLSAFGIIPFISFKILFGIMAVLTIIALAKQKKMKSLGSLPVRDALEVIFSIRDLRTISILDRLNKAEDSREEKLLLGELHNMPSSLAVDDLLERTRSPMLSMRQESIITLEKMQSLGENAEKALIYDIVNNPFTTAYLSARILGDRKIDTAIPLLRELVFSDDYMLAGEAFIALAKMNDKVSRPQIEKIILNTDNPRLKIMGTEALGLFHCYDSIPVLFDLLRGANPPPYLRDEVAMAASSILNTQKKFYRIMIQYAADNSLAGTLAMDEAESAFEYVNSILNGKKKAAIESISLISGHAGFFYNTVEKYFKENDGSQLSQWISGLPEPLPGAMGRASPGDEHDKSAFLKSVLSKAVPDKELSVHNCLRLLIVHWAAHTLREWAENVK
ncbi:MAG: MFS transporter [Treponema sp.]|nr:MFS transporter [Treponema sp.]